MAEGLDWRFWPVQKQKSLFEFFAIISFLKEDN